MSDTEKKKKAKKPKVPLATWSCQLRHLTKGEFVLLRQMCRISKNLYNVALYEIRQEWFTTGSKCFYETYYPKAKQNENYQLIQSNIAQQTLKAATEAFKGFLSLRQLCFEGKYEWNKLELPHYLDKQGYYPLSIAGNSIRITGNKLYIPLSLSQKKDGLQNIEVTLPPQLLGKVIKEVQIIPKYNARFFEIRYIYVRPKEQADVDVSKALSIDFGLTNLATCVTSDGASMIIDGKRIKSLNRLYNKEKARLQSISSHQKQYYTNRMARLDQKRENQITDTMRKTARLILNYCIQNHIGNIVVGWNKGWKDGINIGRKNNQNFVQIPHGKLKNRLKMLCEQYGIRFHEQEESYTSKASFFDNDEIPVYEEGVEQNFSFSGKRVHRGLYRTSTGVLVNADVNGALNILKKSSLMSLDALQGRGCLNHPPRIRVA